ITDRPIVSPFTTDVKVWKTGLQSRSWLGLVESPPFDISLVPGASPRSAYRLQLDLAKRNQGLVGGKIDAWEDNFWKASTIVLDNMRAACCISFWMSDMSKHLLREDSSHYRILCL
ncbi:hypothetical protein AMTR_s00072p00050860, partial [Amborella trichopoda]